MNEESIVFVQNNSFLELLSEQDESKIDANIFIKMYE